MESWRRVWRDGIAPLMSVLQLEVLREALKSDDSRLLQGATMTPAPMMCVQDWPVEAACPLGYCGWQGDGLETVAEVEEFFARMCYEIDQRLGEAGGCREFLNWWDTAPRPEAIKLLLNALGLTLFQRGTRGGRTNPDCRKLVRAYRGPLAKNGDSNGR